MKICDCYNRKHHLENKYLSFEAAPTSIFPFFKVGIHCTSPVWIAEVSWTFMNDRHVKCPHFDFVFFQLPTQIQIVEMKVKPLVKVDVVFDESFTLAGNQQAI